MSGLLDTAAQLASPWAYVVLALAAAAEAAAFVGVVVPGETAMLLGGFLAFQGRVSLGWMMAAGAAGAVVGDSVGYAIGRRLGEPVKRSRLGRRVGRQRWARAEAYLRAKGGRAVFLGRFVGLLRALVPALAGMSRMPYRTFLPWNLAGGVIWAPGFVLLGYLAGSSYRQVERIVGRASLLLLLVVVLAGALVVGARRFARRPDRLRALVDRQLERRWVARLRGRARRQLAFLVRRLQPGGALALSLTASLIALAGLGGGRGPARGRAAQRTAAERSRLERCSWWPVSQDGRPPGVEIGAGREDTRPPPRDPRPQGPTSPNPPGCEMPQVRITKQRRTADTAWRRRHEPLLPLDPRDPEITRAKRLQRRRG
jgi:membrane protein DedA with SNARE-associated domain